LQNIKTGKGLKGKEKKEKD